MRRYWLEQPDVVDRQIEITGDLYKHIFVVCRQQLGHRFELLVGNDRAYEVEVTEVRSKGAKVKIIEERAVPALSKPYIHLALSLPKWSKVDWIVEKAVELGVYDIHPFVSDFSFVREIDRVPASKVQRWEKIILSATQQCGRGQPMEIAPVSDLATLLLRINPAQGQVGLFPYEAAVDLDIKSALKGLSQSQPEDIWLFVGSEGGFSQSEVGQFADRGMAPITLGEHVLRVETACLALVSVIKYELNLMK